MNVCTDLSKVEKRRRLTLSTETLEDRITGEIVKTFVMLKALCVVNFFALVQHNALFCIMQCIHLWKGPNFFCHKEKVCFC